MKIITYPSSSYTHTPTDLRPLRSATLSALSSRPHYISSSDHTQESQVLPSLDSFFPPSALLLLLWRRHVAVLRCAIFSHDGSSIRLIAGLGRSATHCRWRLNCSGKAVSIGVPGRHVGEYVHRRDSVYSVSRCCRLVGYRLCGAGGEVRRTRHIACETPLLLLHTCSPIPETSASAHPHNHATPNERSCRT